MYAFVNKYGQMLAFGIGVLITVIFLGTIFSADPAVFDTLQGDNRSYETDIFNFGMVASIALIIIAFLAAVVFGVIQIASNPKGSLKGIVGLLALALIVFIGYSTANGEIAAESEEIQNAINKFTTSQEATFTSGNLKFISGSILAAVIMLALSVITLVVFGVRSIFQ
ncbi:MAG: hypothetical protein ACJAZ9_000222 [Neolewinella sp.]|jgi:hypothetical protein